ncbi:serine racemase VanT catalytic subunit [Clostridium ganghwense]|uniref:Alanine racemase n=1 Tax=Clostridium ganghwense TaxID=312089 RepID=A0ABT4CQ62_9CLOT|nr:serine racemase VanT catalytic subunit [Clostridium ganghwense]MCY6371197.1 serine racemase VanT catalytic subunit [Clostridium ganghwense]
MKKQETYTGIDYFRIIVAFLIVANHTSPLSTYSETADFILTRIIARIAVPFFFMTSGFFLISKYSHNTNKLKTFIKRTTLIYCVAIAIYIPLNIYNKYFTMDNLLPNIVKDIVFDGTLYHLWYLPAAIIGAAIAWFFVKKIGLKWALGITAFLYVVGIFGDSYYGVAEQIPVLKSFYGYLFELFDYTRNGIFFAPVFFVLGGIISNKTIHTSLKNNFIGFAITFSLMIAEGVFLHNLDLQRHDSMYIMLVPCMFFLFSVLTFWKGHRVSTLRTSAMIIYIIHPMMIVAVRMVAKILGLQAFLIDNSLIHFIAVSIVSVTVSILFLILQKHIKVKRRTTSKLDLDRSWIEVDLDNLRHNVDVLQKAMPTDCELMAVIKAEAYGHGSIAVSSCLNQIGIKAFAVATIDEGIELRKYGIQGIILILGYTSPTRAKELHKYDLTQTVIDFNYAVSLNKQGYDIKVHIKIDTGMHRLGFSKNDVLKVVRIFKAKHLNVCGIYTHLCVADSLDTEDVHFTHIQIKTFYALLEELSKKDIKLPKIHIQSSYGLLNYPEIDCDYARIGIALYGILSSYGDETKLKLDLRPVLSLKSQVVLIREINEGESVGYARAFIAKRDSRIAVLPIGYADGFPRNLSCGNGNVLIHGYRVPIIGRICMDQLIVDITDVPNVNIGDTATLIGKDGQAEICVTEVAENVDSITNELLSRMGSRLKIINL